MGDKVVEAMKGVNEYAENYEVKLVMEEDTGRLGVKALNEGGHNCTVIDLCQLLGWVQKHRPDLIDKGE